nr:vacuolar protein sorting-associated protein 2 homolog 1 [Ipomoea batatas]
MFKPEPTFAAVDSIRNQMGFGWVLREDQGQFVAAESIVPTIAMSFLFGKKKTPAELLRENKRMLDKSIREIERERQGLQAQEKKLIAEIKKSAKQGQMGAVKVMAKDLIRTRHQIEKFYKLKSQLQGVSLRIQTLKSTQAMGEAMKGVTKAMGKMNRQMNLPALQRIMQEFEMQNEKMEMVLDEIGIDMNSELLNAPSSAVAAPAAKTKVPQAEATGNDDGGIDSDLQASDRLRMKTHDHADNAAAAAAVGAPEADEAAGAVAHPEARPAAALGAPAYDEEVVERENDGGGADDDEAVV